MIKLREDLKSIPVYQLVKGRFLVYPIVRLERNQ